MTSLGIVTSGLIAEYVGKLAKGGTAPGDNADAGTRATWDNLVGTPDGSLAGSWAYTAANGWAGSGTDADPYRLEFGASSNDYVASTADATQAGGHTWEAWLRHTDGVNRVTLFVHGGNAVGEFNCSIGVSLNRPILYLGGGNFRYWVDPGAGVRDGGYHHWVVTLPGAGQTDINTATLTIDGTLISVYSTPATGAPSAWTSGLQIRAPVGRPPLAVAAFRSYSRVLGTTEITQNFNAGVLAASTDTGDATVYATVGLTSVGQRRGLTSPGHIRGLTSHGHERTPQ